MAKNWLISNKKTVAMLLLAVFLFGLDRYLKNLALSNFSGNIVGDLLWFGFAPNYGIAFSLPLGGIFLNLLIFGILLGLLVWAAKLFREGKMSLWMGASMAILGAISNLADRLIYGYVIDYLDLSYFTVFNLADVLICLGVGWLIWQNKEDRS